MEMNDSVIEQQRYIRLDSKQMACIAANLKRCLWYGFCRKY